MYRVWFTDLEKALGEFRKVVPDKMFASITGNMYGDFVIVLNDSGDTESKYIVKHDDLSVWRKNNDATWEKIN